MEYKITACPSFKGIGLCNQLCLVLNALEQAFQVVAHGEGVVVKTEIRQASYGGMKLITFPPSGYQWVNQETLLPNTQVSFSSSCFLEIDWHHEARHPSRHPEGVLVHWLDGMPFSVCVYIDKFITHYSSGDDTTPYHDILDLASINQSLLPWGVRVECQDSQLTPNSLYYMVGGFTPRKTLLFRKLIPLLRFHPNFYHNINAWLGGRRVSHAIHLRNEQDAVDHWSTLTNIPATIYQQKLHNAYKGHIQRHVDKKNLTILLTAYKQNNPVILWMKQEGYTYDMYPMEGMETKREISAIYDLILASHCQDLFIGAYQKDSAVFMGSTFSFFISHLLPDNTTQILIDLDNLR